MSSVEGGLHFPDLRFESIAAMESPQERMPIACVHCAKAKARCDKKVPCSRCVGKQLVCQSRATRRSSHNPTRRQPNLPRPQSERNLYNSGYLSQFSSPTHDGSIVSPSRQPDVVLSGSPLTTATGILSPHGLPSHRMSLPDMAMHVPPGMFGSELDPQVLRNGFTQTPPDVVPHTPVMPHMQMENFVLNGPFDSEGDNQFLMGSAHPSMMDFTEFMSPPSTSMLQDMNDQFGKGLTQSPNHNGHYNMHVGPPPLKAPASLQITSKMQTDSSPSSSSARGLQEPDAVTASHQAWPFFLCNPVEKFSFAPPRTAAIYLEGLAQTLRNQDTWKAWTAQIDEKALDEGLQHTILTKPVEGWSREKLLAITQIFLHRALEVHKAGHGNREVSPASSPDSGLNSFLMLPPPDVMQYFLKSYAVRYEPYYSSIPGRLLDPNVLMQSANSKAASLLILLMVASGASATPTVEARYISSGLTEACRLSLLNTIETDVLQSREILILRSALLFITLAAWSGDKWHMDMAMGQRGMYLAMLSHAGMLEAFDSSIDVQECQRDPARAWEEWKEHEGKYRLAHSWVVVDQEMSLFSDTTPALSVVSLHAPMPDAEEIWQATNAVDWLSAFQKVHATTYQSPLSVRDMFTRFVDGDLVNAGGRPTPTQLRLLLHPLQAQVCQLRQFISLLPDGGNHARASRAVSKSATKARLEEISTLLEQWYSLSLQSVVGKEGTCWTTCASLIMYHLISLNAITDFRCIEQFARREVVLGPFRHASWLQMRCIDQAEETFFHCGQVLRLIKSMPEQIRPPWWAGAIYRVALTAWANSMASAGSRLPNNGNAGQTQQPFAIDALAPEDNKINRYLKYQEGIPMLSRVDGSFVPMDVPRNVLEYCIDILEDDPSMRLTDGIRQKLRTFANGWKEN